MKGKGESISDKVSRLNFAEFTGLVFICFLLFVRFVYIFSYDTDLEGVEFALVHFVQMIVLKGHLYGNAAKFPYLLVVHAPLYYYFMAGIMKLAAVDVINNVHLMYIIGRTFSFILLLANIGLLSETIKLVNEKTRNRIFIILLFILFLPAHYYSCRPDSLKVTCFLLFLYFTILHIKNKKKHHFLFSLLFLGIGVYSKQDIFIYGCIVYGVLYLQTKNKQFLFAPFYLLSLVFLTIILYYQVSGINLFKQLFVYNLQYDSDISINLKLIAAHIARVFPLIILSLLNLRSKEKLTLSLAVISLFAFLTSVLFMLRIGSNFNYTYESVILLLMNAELYISEKNKKTPYLLFFFYILFLFLFNQQVFYKSYFISSEELNYKTTFESNEKSAKKVKQLIGQQVIFIPDMKYYIFFAESNLIYGSDWHYDRYCEIALDINIKPRLIRNTVVDEYDKQFTNGKVKYILTDNSKKSENHIIKYYPSYNYFMQTDHFILYEFKSQKTLN